MDCSLGIFGYICFRFDFWVELGFYFFQLYIFVLCLIFWDIFSFVDLDIVEVLMIFEFDLVDFVLLSIFGYEIFDF